MYSHFKGNIEEIFEDRIILDVNDIGYEIYMPESEILSLKEEKNKIKIYTKEVFLCIHILKEI